MKIQIVKNKYLNALFLLMLFSAIAHLALLLVFAMFSKNAYTLNYFNILDLDLFWGNIFNNIWGNITSSGVVLLIYIMLLKFNMP